MDGAQFAKMLSDKHLLELNRMEDVYKRQVYGRPKPGEPTEQQTRWTARMMDTQSALKWSLMRNVPVLQSLWSICLKSSTRTA